MKIQLMHSDAQIPTRATEGSGGYDLYMPVAGSLRGQTNHSVKVGLGIAAEVPKNHVALILPRSGRGSKGLSLNNTCGVIDSDYRGEWFAFMRLRDSGQMHWDKGDRLFQFLLVPVACPELTLGTLGDSERGEGGIGSTGN